MISCRHGHGTISLVLSDGHFRYPEYIKFPPPLHPSQLPDSRSGVAAMPSVRAIDFSHGFASVNIRTDTNLSQIYRLQGRPTEAFAVYEVCGSTREKTVSAIFFYRVGYTGMHPRKAGSPAHAQTGSYSCEIRASEGGCFRHIA